MLLHFYQIKCDVVVVVVTHSTHFKSYFKCHKVENIQFLYTIYSYSWCCICLQCYEQYITLHLQDWRSETTSATVNISFLCFCGQPDDDYHYLTKDAAGLVHEIKLFFNWVYCISCHNVNTTGMNQLKIACWFDLSHYWYLIYCEDSDASNYVRCDNSE